MIQFIAMTKEQEIERYQKEYRDQWERLLTIPEFAKAVGEMNVVEVGEIANREVRGNFDLQSDARIAREYF
jgi:hypothetical protein